MGAPPTTLTAAGANGLSNGGDRAPQQLVHDPGVAVDWSAAEQSVLDDGLSKYLSETSSIVKYIRVAALLPDKTVRDVALRCHWMSKKENGRKQKADEQNGTKKSKDKREKAEALSKQVAPAVARSGMPMYTPPPPPIDDDDGISNDAIGGTTGQLLEQNSQVIAEIRANLAACQEESFTVAGYIELWGNGGSEQLQGNIDLLVRFRNNVFAILDGMTNMPGIMSEMPPLPVKLNSELADSILPESPASAPVRA